MNLWYLLLRERFGKGMRHAERVDEFGSIRYTKTVLSMFENEDENGYYGYAQTDQFRVEAAFYHTLEAIARQERRSVPQAARLLLEEGLRLRLGGKSVEDDTHGAEIARLAEAGGAFDWLREEPDLYDDTCGEPI